MATMIFDTFNRQMSVPVGVPFCVRRHSLINYLHGWDSQRLSFAIHHPKLSQAGLSKRPVDRAIVFADVQLAGPSAAHRQHRDSLKALLITLDGQGGRITKRGERPVDCLALRCQCAKVREEWRCGDANLPSPARQLPLYPSQRQRFPFHSRIGIRVRQFFDRAVASVPDVNIACAIHAHGAVAILK